MTKSSDSSPKWGSLSCRGTRRQIRGGAGAASLCGEYTTTKSYDSSPEWGSRSRQSTRMVILNSAGATLLWRVYNDWDLRLEPIARLVTVPEHSYANTRLRWCGVVVESKQRLCLKSRAQSGARNRAKALVCRYEIVMMRLVIESPHCLLKESSPDWGTWSCRSTYSNTGLRWCGVVVESTQRLCRKNRAQSGARGRARALGW